MINIFDLDDRGSEAEIKNSLQLELKPPNKIKYYVQLLLRPNLVQVEQKLRFGGLKYSLGVSSPIYIYISLVKLNIDRLKFVFPTNDS